MINIKSKKGVTLVTLVITVIVLLILSGTVMYNSKSTNDVGKYNNMVADIKLLEDEVLIYYNKYGELPITNRVWERDIEEVGNVKYYEIDLSKLEGLTLNYGNDYGKEDELTEEFDVYLVNSNLHIYYLKGVEKSGELHHFVDNNVKYAPDIEEDIIEEEELPEGLVKLEYIESTGTQYINTNLYPSNIMKIEIDTSSTDNTSVFGGDGLNTSSLYNLTGNTTRSFRYGATRWNNSGYSFKERAHIIFGRELYLDGNLIYTFPETEFKGKYNLILFGRFNDANSLNDAGRVAIYYCKIYENNILVRDYIPCKDHNGVVCLYDKVEGKYYYNQGTGDFIAGPEV